MVAVRRQGRFLDVELYHCKFSTEPTPGARVADLYEVCGQAMKAVRWADPRSKFLQRLRDRKRTAFEPAARADSSLATVPFLMSGWRISREMVTRFSMTLVQPGYSRAKAAPEISRSRRGASHTWYRPTALDCLLVEPLRRR